MNQPRIGIAGVVRSWDGASRTGVNSAYVQAVMGAGGLPLIVSPLAGPARAGAFLDAVDGLLLTGGEDVDPALYGATPSPRLGAVSRERDLFELALVREAAERQLPVLGICRGLQLINVALGGTLWQDLGSERTSHLIHDPPADRGARSHGIRITAGSRAATALGGVQLRVNSLHHQGVRELAPALTATAWAEDGLIEAAEGPPEGSWLLAVQWHPEELAEGTVADRGLFAGLVREAASRATGPAQAR